jgi:hypothetical protein
MPLPQNAAQARAAAVLYARRNRNSTPPTTHLAWIELSKPLHEVAHLLLLLLSGFVRVVSSHTVQQRPSSPAQLQYIWRAGHFILNKPERLLLLLLLLMVRSICFRAGAGRGGSLNTTTTAGTAAAAAARGGCLTA